MMQELQRQRMGYNDGYNQDDGAIEAEGIVKSMRKDKTAVLIEVNLSTGPKESWCDLADNVKPEYIRVGAKCHFKYISGEKNPVITYIKCEANSGYDGGNTNSNSNYPKKPYSPNYNQSKKEEYAPTEETYRMSACKSAAQVFGNAVSTNDIKVVQDFKKLSEEILAFIKTGSFEGKANGQTAPVSKGELFGSENQDNF